MTEFLFAYEMWWIPDNAVFHFMRINNEASSSAKCSFKTNRSQLQGWTSIENSSSTNDCWWLIDNALWKGLRYKAYMGPLNSALSVLGLKDGPAAVSLLWLKNIEIYPVSTECWIFCHNSVCVCVSTVIEGCFGCAYSRFCDATTKKVILNNYLKNLISRNK